MTARLKEHRVIVVGAASGIGRATALQCMAEGARVAALDRDRAALDALRAEAPAIVTRTCDITETQEAEAALDEAIRELGGLDGLVNSAGTDAIRPFAETDAALWSRMFAVNVIGPMMMARAALGSMSAGGSIVNVSSAAGLQPLDSRSAYCASKSALLMATKVMAKELASRDIRVNAVCPGVVDTPMLRKSWEEAADPEAARAEVLSRNAQGRIATPDSIAAGILYLLSDESDFVTGSTLAIDGGRAFH